MRAAAVAPLRFGRCTSCVVKVFEEISDVIPSDAYQIARYRGWISEIADISEIGQNPGTSWIFMDFRGFERGKPF